MTKGQRPRLEGFQELSGCLRRISGRGWCDQRRPDFFSEWYLYKI